MATVTKYTYSISEDTYNGIVNTNLLSTEIHNNTSIIISISYIETVGNVLDIYMKDVLTQGEETALDGVIAAHSGASSNYNNPTITNKMIIQPDIFRMGTYANYVGVGDDITNGIRFGGSLLKIDSSTTEEKTLEFQFLEAVDLLGSLAFYATAVMGDWISFECNAPATTATSNEGAGAYAKEAIIEGVLNRFKPQENGDWDLNLTEKLNSNVNFTKVVPIPNTSGAGYFDYNEDNEVVSLNTAGTGDYDLYDLAITLAKIAVKLPIYGSGHTNLIIPAVRPRLWLPHWKGKLILNNSTTKSLSLYAMFLLGRAELT